MKRIDILVGYESLTLSATESKQQFGFSGPRVLFETSFLFKKKYALGLFGEAKVLKGAFTKESGETETLTSFGGGGSFAFHFGKKERFFGKLDIGYGQLSIKTAEHDFLKSYQYPNLIIRLSTGWAYFGKSASFLIAPALEVNSLSSGTNLLYPDNPVSDLLGIGGSFSFGGGYIF